MPTKLKAAETPSSESEQPALEELSRQLEAVRHELAQLGKVSANAAKQRFNVVSSGSTEALTEGADLMGDAAEQFAAWVRKKPLSTLALAGGVGLLCGLFATKR